MKSKFTVNNTLELGDYIYLVDEIADGFFGIDGNYQPHIGSLNAMRIYYASCVVKSIYDDVIPHDVIDLGEMQSIISDKDFQDYYKRAISETDGFDITFGNAYKMAMDIVEQKNYSIKAGVDTIKQAIVDLADKINPAFSEDTLKQLSTIAKEIDKGNLTPNALWEAYSQSEAFKQTLDRADKRASSVINIGKNVKK